MSIEGFCRLFDRLGLDVVSASTPGVLGVDIVRNAYYRNPELFTSNRFVRQLMANYRHAARFQEFLAGNCLSLHAWVFTKKV